MRKTAFFMVLALLLTAMPSMAGSKATAKMAGGAADRSFIRFDGIDGESTVYVGKGYGTKRAVF